nr:hypothetical protein [Sicyoidochytrium minutum DNA virus]
MKEKVSEKELLEVSKKLLRWGHRAVFILYVVPLIDRISWKGLTCYYSDIRRIARVRFRRFFRGIVRVIIIANRYKEDYYNPDNPKGYIKVLLENAPGSRETKVEEMDLRDD